MKKIHAKNIGATKVIFTNSKDELNESYGEMTTIDFIREYGVFIMYELLKEVPIR